MATPIWKDTDARYVSVASAMSLTISVDGDIVFNGKVNKMPGAPSIQVFVNRIAKDYLSSKIDFKRGTTAFQQSRHKRRFDISPRTQNGLSYLEFYNDWSYEDASIVPNVSQTLSSPLSNIVDPRQILFTTMAKISDGESTGEVSIDYCDNNMCMRPVRATPAPCVTFAYPLAGISEGVDIDILNEEDDTAIRYKVKKTCADYALYYLNAYGGYDHLLINGNTMRKDDITRTEITKSVNNSTLAHGKQCVAMEITPRWELYTDYLTDKQWSKTHHLLGSSHVLLHDLNTDEITPVNITSSTAEFKTYRNQGNKKSYLTIEVEASVKRMRK